MAYYRKAMIIPEQNLVYDQNIADVNNITKGYSRWMKMMYASTSICKHLRWNDKLAAVEARSVAMSLVSNDGTEKIGLWKGPRKCRMQEKQYNKQKSII